MPRYIDDDWDPETRDRHYFHATLDLVVSFLLGAMLASVLSAWLWVPTPPAHEAVVLCNSAAIYNVTERVHLQLGQFYQNSHWYTQGHPSVSKLLPVDVSYVVHTVVCHGRGLNWTHLRVEDAFGAGDPALAVALKGVARWHNETRYTYESCRWRDCLYSEPVEDSWWFWFLIWIAGVVTIASTFFMAIWPCRLLEGHYMRWQLYEAWQRAVAMMKQRQQPREHRFAPDASWRTDCV